MVGEGAGAQPQTQPEAPVSIPPPPAITDAIELLDRALCEMERASPEAVIDCIERARRILKVLTATPLKRHRQTRRQGQTQP